MKFFAFLASAIEASLQRCSNERDGGSMVTGWEVK